MKSSLSIISFMDYAFSVVSKNSWWNTRSQFSPMFCPRNLIVRVLYLDLLIHFELIFAKGVMSVWIHWVVFFFNFEKSVVPGPFVEKKKRGIFFLLCCLCQGSASLSEISWLYLSEAIWRLSVLFWSVYSFSNTTCFDYYNFTVSL